MPNGDTLVIATRQKQVRFASLSTGKLSPVTIALDSPWRSGITALIVDPIRPNSYYASDLSSIFRIVADLSADGASAVAVPLLGSKERGCVVPGKSVVFDGVSGLAITSDGRTLWATDRSNDALHHITLSTAAGAAAAIKFSERVPEHNVLSIAWDRSPLHSPETRLWIASNVGNQLTYTTPPPQSSLQFRCRQRHRIRRSFRSRRVGMAHCS